MDFVCLEPEGETRSWVWWLCVGFGILGLVVLYKMHLGSLWYPPHALWMLPMYGAFGAIVMAGLLGLWRARTMASLVVYPRARFVLPVGYLDTTSALWTFVPLSAMTDVSLRRLSRDSALVAVPRYELSLHCEGGDVLRLVLEGQQLSEESLHVMEHLIDDQASALTGLAERIEAIDALLTSAETTQGTSLSHQANDEFSARLAWWLREPLLPAMLLGCVVGGIVWGRHNQLHARRQLASALLQQEADVPRMLLQLTSDASAKKRLSSLIAARYQRVLGDTVRHLRPSAVPMIKELLRAVQAQPQPIVQVVVDARPYEQFAFLSQFQRQLRGGSLVRQNRKRPASRPSVASSRPTRSVPAFRDSRLSKQAKALGIPGKWVVSLARTMKKEPLPLDGFSSWLTPQMKKRLPWLMVGACQKALASIVPEDVVRLQVKGASEAFQSFYLYGRNRHLQAAQARRRRIQANLLRFGKGLTPVAKWKQKVVRLYLRMGLWPTGTTYDIKTMAKTKAGVVRPQSKVRLLGVGLVVSMRLEVPGKRPYRLLFTLPPSPWFGFLQEDHRLTTDQSERSQAYSAMMAEMFRRLTKRILKQWKKRS
jgi:hypothetical protein